MASTPFPLPDLGQKIKQGKIKKLYIKEGDIIQQFQKLADVQSDKQFTEITSPESGKIKKLYYKQDEICQVGQILLDIQTLDKKQIKQKISIKKQQKKVQKIIKQQNKQSKYTQLPQNIITSPTVIKWAKENNVDLLKVNPTGRKGRILKGDVINFIQNRNKKQIKGKVIEQAKIILDMNPIKVTMNQQNKIQNQISLKSLKIPHLYLEETFNVSQLNKITTQIAKNNKKISLLSLLIKTLSIAIKLNPRINCKYNISSPFQYKIINNQNLLIPFSIQNGIQYKIINNLQNISIIQLQKQLQRQYIPLKNNSSIFQSSTLSLSVSTALSSNPLIYSNHICHINVGKIRQMPILKNSWTKADQINITFGCDHRVIDGATVAKFANSWKQLVQNPSLSFIYMI